ncbi:MAG TPA: right-handed parallel beta-helix repeat-containing protein, partial [Longimicrobium sp.]|nr:right-handed parallel beta-helix repeat-containing protein [Longimicrobium sp.]
VELGAGTRFEQTMVRGSAATGVRVSGTDVLLLGGRIQGSRGTGLDASADSLNRYSKAVRVVGAGGYGAMLSVPALRRLYSTPALQDSLLGNARDTLVLSGGTLRGGQVIVGGRLPLRVTGTIELQAAGTLSAQPGAVLVFAPLTRIVGRNGGRMLARGSAAQPVLFTADDAVRGWGGLTFYGDATTGTTYLTNVRIEHVTGAFPAVGTYIGQPVIVDSSVIRQTGFAVALYTANSRLMRTRVDTTLDAERPAVELLFNARIESTRIRAPAGPGLSLLGVRVQVVSCEIRDGDQEGIVVGYTEVPIRNCNLVDNAGPGIRFVGENTLNATGNWWGSTGGPLGPGGDGVSAPAGPIVYSPWRTTPFVLPYLP